MKKWWEWRLVGLFQFFIFLADLPVFVMLIFIFCTLVRIYPLHKELTEELQYKKISEKYSSSDTFVYSGFKIRAIIIKQFIIVFVDLFCIIFVFFLLISWRNVIFVRRFIAAGQRENNSQAENEFKQRKIIFIEFLNLLLDIPCLICFAFTFFTWRAPMVIIDIKHARENNKDWNEIRFVGLYHFFLFIIDVPCIAVGLVAMCSWRAPMVIYSLLESSLLERRSSWKSHWKIRQQLVLQFIYLFIDIPVILCFLVVLVTIWRMPALVKQLKKHLQKDYNRKNFYKVEFKIRASCFKQFGMIWVDFFTFLLAVIVFGTLWRANPLYKDIKKAHEKYKNPPQEGEEEVKKCLTPIDPPHTFENGKSPSSINEEGETQGKKVDPTETTVAFKNGSIDTVETGEITMETDNETKEEQESKELNECVPKMKWSKFIWKIRRKIATHFSMLLMDIPAIPLSILVLCTGLRTSKLLSSLLGGKFYLLFAVTVYMETLKLFRDIAFIFLFFILMALRPINSWVHLLEDDDHREYRIVKDLSVWIPDICTERKETYDVMEDNLALYIKQQKEEKFICSELDILITQHLKRIIDLLEKFEKFDIGEGEIISLLKIVEHAEKKRVGKMKRKYLIESSYIKRCDRELHDTNLRNYKDEMMKYEDEVNNAYEKLFNYKPTRVPLYADRSGLKLRSRKETRDVLIACLPRGRFLIGIMAFICTLFMYRAPRMYKALFRKSYDAFNIITSTLKEYGKDLLAILQILLVIVLLYRAPAMLADIMDCIIQKRSWRGVRKIVRKYPLNILHDIGQIFKKLFSWESIRYTFVMILFGILMPAELFLVVVRTCIKDKCISFIFTALLYIIFIIGPLVFATYGTDKLMSLDMGWVIEVAICAFLLVLLLLLLIMILSLAKDKKKKFLMDVRKCDYVRFNWYNMHVVLFEILEFLQTLALVFKFISIPMYGGEVLSKISSYFLFSFFSYDVIFWITVVAFICWFFLCGAPPIFENILEKYDPGSIGKRPSWRLGLSLLANTLFVTIIENFLSSLACTYYECPTVTTISGMFLAGINGTNSTTDVCYATSQLIEDPTVQCWTIEHQGKATFALIAIVWYTTTSLIFGTKYGDPETKELDIVFCPIYNMIINVFKAGIVVIATILTDRQYVVLGFLMVIFILCIFYTVSFQFLFNTDACNLRSVLVWRFCTFISSIFACISVIVAFVLNDPESIVPLLIFLVGTFVTFCVSVIAAVKLSQTSDIERDREAFKKLIIKLEKRTTKESWMHKHWLKERKTWLRLVGSVREAWSDDRYLTNALTAEQDLIDTPEVVQVDLYKADTMESNTATYNEVSGTSPTTVENESTTTQPPESTDAFALKSIEERKELIDVDTSSPKPLTPQYQEPSDFPLPPSYSPDEPIINVPAPPSYGSSDHSTVSPETRNIVPTYFVSDSTIELEKNGRNLLLIFEKYVYYNAYRYASLFQRGFWINNVCESNWTGLLQQLQILNRNLDGMYCKPSNFDIHLANLTTTTGFELGLDEQDINTPPPPFVRKTKEDIAVESSKLRAEILEFVGRDDEFGDKFRELFNKLLPTTPVIKSFVCMNYSGDFKITLRRVSTGKITSCQPPGLKIAVGASVSLGKIVEGCFYCSRLHSLSGVTGKKGPVTVSVGSVLFLHKNNTLYLEANGKKVKYDVAISSCKTIEWS